MPTRLETLVNGLVSSHPFFTTFVGRGVTVAERRLLARKLYLYEARGRPVNTREVDLDRIDSEVTLFWPRPQLTLVRDRVATTLTRFAAAPYVAGEPVLNQVRRFPAIYWAARGVSGSQWSFVRDIIRRFAGITVSGGPTISRADLAAYAALARRVDDGYANTDRARLIAKYNAADYPVTLPGVGLADPPLV